MSMPMSPCCACQMMIPVAARICPYCHARYAPPPPIISPETKQAVKRFFSNLFAPNPAPPPPTRQDVPSHPRGASPPQQNPPDGFELSDLDFPECDLDLFDGDVKRTDFLDNESFAAYISPEEEIRDNLLAGTLVAVFLLAALAYAFWYVVSWIVP